MESSFRFSALVISWLALLAIAAGAVALWAPRVSIPLGMAGGCGVDQIRPRHGGHGVGRRRLVRGGKAPGQIGFAAPENVEPGLRGDESEVRGRHIQEHGVLHGLRLGLPGGLALGAYGDAELRARSYSDGANLLDRGTRLLIGCGVSMAWPLQRCVH